MFLIILSIIGASILGAFSAKFFLRSNHISLGFAGGAILALVFLLILPEVFEEATLQDIPLSTLSVALMLGFLGMHVLEKLSGFHDHGHGEEHSHGNGGKVAVVVLSLHAFIDGVGIGTAYLVSNSLVSAIIFAFILHKFLDGINIQAIAQASHSKNRNVFLFANILVTVLGVFSIYFFTFSETALLFLVALVGGVLLYVSSAHILPEAHEHEDSWKTILATLTGVVIVFLISHFVV